MFYLKHDPFRLHQLLAWTIMFTLLRNVWCKIMLLAIFRFDKYGPNSANECILSHNSLLSSITSIVVFVLTKLIENNHTRKHINSIIFYINNSTCQWVIPSDCLTRKIFTINDNKDRRKKDNCGTPVQSRTSQANW